MGKTLSEASFSAIADFFHQRSGIRLQPSKRHMVVSRLNREAVRRQCASLNDYVALILAAPQSAEARHVVDILTTNETYFFRESAHFRHLAQLLQHAPCTQALRAWSAAASSGEEAYSIAMTLAQHAGGRPWEVIGTDLSTRVVAQARQGLYAAERCARITLPDLKRWCLRGEGPHEGQVLMNRELRAKVRFEIGNLLEPMPELGQFDVTEIRKDIGFVTPAHDLQWPLDGLDVVLTGITGTLETPMRWEPSSDEVSRALDAMREVGVDHLATTEWYVMSQGERGRVLVARALILQPTLLVLDEPMTGLDLTAREQLLDTLDDLARVDPALTSVLVTHHIDELPASTTHAALMSHGRLVAAGPAAEVLTSANVTTAFEHPIDVSYVRGRWAARSSR